MIRIQIVDDQYLFLDSLELFLKQDGKLLVTGTASGGRQALSMIERDPPDILLLDLKMPDLGGLEVARAVKKGFPSVRIIMLTTFEVEEDILEAFAIGCEGYIIKDIKPAELITAVHSVYGGLIVMHPASHHVIRNCIRKNLGHHLAMAERQTFETLTGQELHIVQLISEGKSNKEIAAELGYSEGTVKNYISRILQKTGCKDRTQIAVQSLKQDLA